MINPRSHFLHQWQCHLCGEDHSPGTTMFVFASNYLSVSNFVHKGSVAFFSFLSVMSSIGDKIVTKIHWLVMYYMYYNCIHLNTFQTCSRSKIWSEDCWLKKQKTAPPKTKLKRKGRRDYFWPPSYQLLLVEDRMSPCTPLWAVSV